ncbi:VCBS repeat-containing protein [Cellulophaga baltica]|uniref:VCBS repeat-containing protein n=1 Tax=Cellulophaga baltica TaxID=76594 RepID=UPI0024942A81|nr:VCBS repeat-containing protein [Cellulophaga baltica]
MRKIYLFILPILTLFSCNSPKNGNNLFELKGESTGITFQNNLAYTEELNPYTYRNFYNGGGVALGDINNDGLLDIYFTGNLVDNKLYLNKGNWEFEDITVSAGVSCSNVWSSGVTFVDINNDNLLDIYVCKAGPPSEHPNRHNELFINNGDLTFTEESKKYGLDIVGLSVQSAFFDYDKDGDLDCYLLNNSIRSIGGYDLIKDQRNVPTSQGNKLLKNENGIFLDVSNENNIYTSAIGFGLGITLSDFNGDSWTDIYISNDFFEKDYLYLNNKGLNFTEALEENFSSIPMGSMGADIADLDNDLLPDLMVTEMLPKTLDRKKTKTSYDSWDKYSLAVKNGYYHQYPRNTLQRNMGDAGFMEISRFAEVDATEWSWGTLIFDIDNDGLKDIFVSNGIYKDLLDRDYLNYMANEETIRNMITNDKEVITKLIDLMPSNAVPNATFLNEGHFLFTESSSKLGLDQPSFSNGSAYGDLDNDGDLDLVINNVNMPSFIYENKSDSTVNKSIKIRFKGGNSNTNAIGTKVIAYYNNGTTSYHENYPSKGFQSSIAPEIVIGLGSTNNIDSLSIEWPENKKTILKNLRSNFTYTANQKDSKPYAFNKHPNKETTIKPSDTLVAFKHEENNYIDFKREQLLDRMTNNEGPSIAVADINNDNYQDLYIGGAKNQSGKLFLSNTDGTYKTIDSPFTQDKYSEDTDAVFFDSDNDGDLDLYVSSGGKAFSKYDYHLDDRLYINENNTYKKNVTPLPFPKRISSATVSVSDYDKDGDLDLFIGERYNPQVYGQPGSGYILKNNGNNNYSLDKQASLINIGMITASEWVDINNDTWPDLVVGGEWMPITVLINTKGKFSNQTSEYHLDNSIGIWTALKTIDVDNDGDLDIVAGNIGKNTFYKKGTTIFIDDFDLNGTTEQVICQKIKNKYYPILDRDELLSQMPSLKKKILYYKDYSMADMTMIFSPEVLKNALKIELDTPYSTLFLNNENSFSENILPPEIQYSSVHAIEALDVDNDGLQDLFLGGNQFLIKPQFGKLDASKGWLLLNKMNDENYFGTVEALNIDGQIRDFKIIEHQTKTILTTSINNNYLLFHEIKIH